MRGTMATAGEISQTRKALWDILVLAGWMRDVCEGMWSQWALCSTFCETSRDRGKFAASLSLGGPERTAETVRGEGTRLDTLPRLLQRVLDPLSTQCED